jgi:hypothetical protein
MQDGRLVSETYSKFYLDHVRRTLRQIRTEFAKAHPDDNAVPVIRDAEGVMAWLRAKITKTIIQVEADATAMDSSVGRVAGHDDDDDEEVSRWVQSPHRGDVHSAFQNGEESLRNALLV